MILKAFSLNVEDHDPDKEKEQFLTRILKIVPYLAGSISVFRKKLLGKEAACRQCVKFVWLIPLESCNPNLNKTGPFSGYIFSTVNSKNLY